MWIDIEIKTRMFCDLLHDLPDAHRRELSAAARGKKNLAPRLLRHALGASALNVGAQRVTRLFSNRYDARFVAFAGDANDAVFEIEEFELRIDQLRYAQAAGVKQLKDRAVAQAARRVHIDTIEQAIDLEFVHRLRQVALDPRERDGFGDVVRNSSAC